MNEKLFVIAIGGTGMRCLESFVHLCAIGMFDGKEIHILTLDTDQTNGNKSRVENLIEVYNQVRHGGGTDNARDDQFATADTLFSARLHLSHFVTPYNAEEGDTYRKLRTKGVTEREENDELSQLFYDRATQDFSLKEGYRARTHLGSMLMYMGIVDAAAKVNASPSRYAQYAQLKEFIEKMQDGGPCRVFVFGSVFGGTGASSIPVIPRALCAAADILIPGNGLRGKMMFGSTLLTNYFTFAESNEQDVIAKASGFALNSQAALNFYNNDPTVMTAYRRFYQIGWPFPSIKVDGERRAAIGGFDQRNDCHFVELMAAAAAYDFFRCPADELTRRRDVTYMHRMVEVEDGKLAGVGGRTLFDDTATADAFEGRLGAMLTLSHLILGAENGAWDDGEEWGLNLFLQLFEKNGIPDYSNFDPRQARTLNTYLRLFAYEGNGGGITPGWLYQVHRSLVPVVKDMAADGLFRPEVAFAATRKELNDGRFIGGLFVAGQRNWRPGRFNPENCVSRLKSEMGRTAAATPGKGLNKFLRNYFRAVMKLQGLPLPD